MYIKKNIPCDFINILNPIVIIFWFNDIVQSQPPYFSTIPPPLLWWVSVQFWTNLWDEFVIEFSTFLYTIYSNTNFRLENKGPFGRREHRSWIYQLKSTTDSAQLEQIWTGLATNAEKLVNQKFRFFSILLIYASEVWSLIFWSIFGVIVYSNFRLPTISDFYAVCLLIPILSLQRILCRLQKIRNYAKSKIQTWYCVN